MTRVNSWAYFKVIRKFWYQLSNFLWCLKSFNSGLFFHLNFPSTKNLNDFWSELSNLSQLSSLSCQLALKWWLSWDQLMCCLFFVESSNDSKYILETFPVGEAEDATLKTFLYQTQWTYSELCWNEWKSLVYNRNFTISCYELFLESNKAPNVNTLKISEKRWDNWKTDISRRI